MSNVLVAVTNEWIFRVPYTVIQEVLPINVNFETFYYERFQVYIKEQFMLIRTLHVLSFSLSIILHLLIFFHLSTHYLFFPGTFLKQIPAVSFYL